MQIAAAPAPARDIHGNQRRRKDILFQEETLGKIEVDSQRDQAPCDRRHGRQSLRVEADSFGHRDRLDIRQGETLIRSAKARGFHHQDVAGTQPQLRVSEERSFSSGEPAVDRFRHLRSAFL